MNKKEFLNELSRRIGGLGETETANILSYYEESIDDRIEDGMTEEEAVESLGSIDGIVSQVVSEMSLISIVNGRIKKGRRSSGLWIALAICGSPVWLPLLLAFAVVILAVYVCVWAVIVSIWAVEVAFAASCIGGLGVGAIYAANGQAIQGAAIIGAGLVCGGLFLVLLFPLAKLCKKIASLTVLLMRKIKKSVISGGRKEGAK